MSVKLARIISIIFHPVLIPTLGTLLLLNSGFYFSMLSWEAKRFVLLVIFFTTSILPMLTVAVIALKPTYNISMPESRDRVIPLLLSSVYFYIGFQLLNKMHAFPAFRLFMAASVLVIIGLLLISFKWKISVHMAAIGSLSGILFALSFRNGMNPLWPIIIVVLVSGIVGTARLALGKHNIWQIIAGYVLGLSVLYFVIYFS
ncbi:MAG: hypothetical protein ABFS16_13945 [Bacteroidota bacterium]